MATIVPTFTKIRGPGGGIDAVVVTWAGLTTTGDVGQPIQRPDLADRSFQAVGTFNSSTIVCEGSNDGNTYGTLTNVAGGALSFTAAGPPLQVTEATAFIRPHLTNGLAGCNVTAIMVLRRSYR